MVRAASRSVPESAISPLAERRAALDRMWRQLLDQQFGGSARLLRWGQEHRVYRIGDRVAKIEMKEKVERDHLLSIEYEFSLLSAIEGRASRLRPTFKVIDDVWCVLEMDWIDGEYLDHVLQRGGAKEVSLFNIIVRLFWVSLAGVYYKNLRARHIIRQQNGKIRFIDFGHSVMMSPVAAFLKNFAPVAKSGERYSLNRVYAIIRETLRESAATRTLTKVGMNDLIKAGLSRWATNATRTTQSRAAALADVSRDPIAAIHLEAMEECLVSVVKAEPSVVTDLIEVHFGDYSLAGSRDWEFVWDYISARINWRGKRVVELGCGIGPIGVYARLDGADHVTCIDENVELLAAAKRFANAVQISDNTYQLIAGLSSFNGVGKLPIADVLTVLSVRLESASWSSLQPLFSRYREILWQTPEPQAAIQLLQGAGFDVIEVLVHSHLQRYVVYASDNRNLADSAKA